MALSIRSKARPVPVVRDLELIVVLAALHLGDEA
jgi:hypothetical protein